MLLFGLDLYGVQLGATRGADRSLSLAVHAGFDRATFPYFQALSDVQGPVVRIVVTLVVAIALLWTRRWRSALVYLAATAGGSLLNQAVKLTVARPRPHLFPGAQYASGYSFPSGHAMDAAVFCGVVTYLCWILFPRRRLLVLSVSAVLATLVGFSRVVLGVHYPSDVLGGWVLGLAWVAFVVAASSTLYLERESFDPVTRGEER